MIQAFSKNTQISNLNPFSLATKSTLLAMTICVFTATLFNSAVFSFFSDEANSYVVAEPDIILILELNRSRRATETEAEQIFSYYKNKWQRMHDAADQRFEEHGLHTYLPPINNHFISVEIDTTPTKMLLQKSLSEWQESVNNGNFDLLLPLAHLYSKMNWLAECAELMEYYYAFAGLTESGIYFLANWSDNPSRQTVYEAFSDPSASDSLSFFTLKNQVISEIFTDIEKARLYLFEMDPSGALFSDYEQLIAKYYELRFEKNYGDFQAHSAPYHTSTSENWTEFLREFTR